MRKPAAAAFICISRLHSVIPRRPNAAPAGIFLYTKDHWGRQCRGSIDVMLAVY